MCKCRRQTPCFLGVLAIAFGMAILLSSVEANQAISWPSPDWQVAEPIELGLDTLSLKEATRHASSFGGAGMVVQQGKVALRWGDQQKCYDVKSATKSFGATMLGVAIQDGKIDLNGYATDYHPTLGMPPKSNVDSGWLKDVTIQHLATHTAGFEKKGGYSELLFQPGTQWHYSDCGPNWLAECITLQYKRDLQELMFERVFTPLGITPQDLYWRVNWYREEQINGIPRREFGAGVHANVNAMARIGYLYLREGQWKDKQIIPKEFVRLASRPISSIVELPEWSSFFGNASRSYGLLWWNNADAIIACLPEDAFWAWGLWDSLIVVVPSLDMVVVRCAEKENSLQQGTNDEFSSLNHFLAPLVAATNPARTSRQNTHRSESNSYGVPHPPSPIIANIEWAPKESIIRLAKGSDNWPLTWADDDHLYTAYGDGWGFEPRVEKKLSLGLARVKGIPPSIQGANLRSDDLEQSGQGKEGIKASGMLMVDGTLYMLVRNASNAQLVWSKDHGKEWTWADWKWTTSFGCPTFLNFGKNYGDSRDDYVYIYSLDGNSAYQPEDQMVMARVSKDQICEREAYEFYAGLMSDAKPKWTKDIRDRAAVFVHKGRCYRSGISYNAGIGRYLWCQILPESNDRRGPRFQGGFGVYDAPEPWGPWTTAYFSEDWDTGPGETSSFPTKWISSDGKSLHLVSSGDDYFSVREATLIVK